MGLNNQNPNMEETGYQLQLVRAHQGMLATTTHANLNIRISQALRSISIQVFLRTAKEEAWGWIPDITSTGLEAP